jgi:predicted metalloenzyme YecM
MSDPAPLPAPELADVESSGIAQRLQRCETMLERIIGIIDGPEWITVAEAARRIGVSRPTFERHYLADPALRVRWQGKRRMIHKRSLRRIMEEREERA